VPLFHPAWWPHAWYNVRYGLQLLPLFAVSAGVVAAFVAWSGAQWAARRKRSSDADLSLLAVCMAVVALSALSYFSVWQAQPLCFTEAWNNTRTKIILESAVARTITELPPHSQYLMYLGEHVGAFQMAGMPLRQVTNECNHRPWMKQVDPLGLWDQALANPVRHVDYVIVFEGDAVDRFVNRSGLKLLMEIHTTGQARARIYTARGGVNQSR
jgi:hypothetical protein